MEEEKKWSSEIRAILGIEATTGKNYIEHIPQNFNSREMASS